MALAIVSLVAVVGCSGKTAEAPPSLIQLGDTTSTAPVPPPSTSTPAPAPAPAPDPSHPHGILAVTFDGDGLNPTSIDLTQIDPVNGSVAEWRSFESVGDARFDIEYAWLDGFPPFRARIFFSPDYDKVVATWTDSDDGSEHVGWITSDGDFVDVTDAVAGSQADFSDAVRNGSPRFGANGMFYFADYNNGSIKRVDPSNMTPGAVKKVKGGVGDHQTFEVYPNGHVVVHDMYEYPDRVENTAVGPFGVKRVEDWIDSKTYLTADWDMDSALMGSNYNQITAHPAWTGKGYQGYPKDGKSLLPKGTRANWNPIVSPDGSRVAFLSATNKQPAPELFTVPSRGGSPSRLDTGYEFTGVTLGTGHSTTTYRLQLLDWL